MAVAVASEISNEISYHCVYFIAFLKTCRTHAPISIIQTLIRKILSEPDHVVAVCGTIYHELCCLVLAKQTARVAGQAFLVLDIIVTAFV
jgi:hypothetical protein